MTTDTRAPHHNTIFGGLPGPWADDALCVQTDPEAFYPEGQGASAAEAKAVCAGCPVREECLRHALSTREPHGVWGGMSERQRRKLLRPAPGAHSCPHDGCTRTFGTRSGVAVHLAKAHSGIDRTVACPFCGNTFAAASGRATHITKVHGTPA